MHFTCGSALSAAMRASTYAKYEPELEPSSTALGHVKSSPIRAQKNVVYRMVPKAIARCHTHAENYIQRTKHYHDIIPTKKLCATNKIGNKCGNVSRRE